MDRELNRKQNGGRTNKRQILVKLTIQSILVEFSLSLIVKKAISTTKYCCVIMLVILQYRRNRKKCSHVLQARLNKKIKT